MVAMCLIPLGSSGRDHRDLDGGRQTGGDRSAPRRGRNVSGGRPGKTFLPREEWPRNPGPRATCRVGWIGQGKKVETGGCGKRARPSAARSAFGQTSHIEAAVDAPVAGTTGMKAGAASSASLSGSPHGASAIPARAPVIGRPRQSSHRQWSTFASGSLRDLRRRLKIVQVVGCALRMRGGREDEPLLVG